MRLFFFTICLLTSFGLKGQYFQFTQYELTPQRINPAMVGASDNASLRLLYRNQATAAGFHLTSNNIDASLPLIDRKGKRWSGVGLSFMDDRSGYAGIYNTQEFAISYALNIQLSKAQTLSFGAKGLVLKRRIDLDGLYTGYQYVEDRGFNTDLYNGENISGVLRNSFFTMSAGLYWQSKNKNGERLAFAGFSFFDFNKPNDEFKGITAELQSSYAAVVGFEAWRRDKIRILPEVLVSGGQSRLVVNGGLVTRFQSSADQYLDIITRYRFGSTGILGLGLQRKKVGVSFTYDFPVARAAVANTGAFEIGLQLRSIVSRKYRGPGLPMPVMMRTRKDKLNKVKPTPLLDTLRYVARERTRPLATSQPPQVAKEQSQLSERLKQKQDSLVRSGYAGDIKHEPLILEKATLYFNFDFGSTDVNEEAALYFDDLAGALLDNPMLKIKLVGHTDNVGSERFNLRLSLERARSIKEYLIRKGVASERIIAEGKGMGEPLNKNLTSEERAKNRRVEMTIIY